MQANHDIDFSNYSFHDVVNLPEKYHVHDFTNGVDKSPTEFSIGRYDEDRKGLYESELFGGIRTLHVGIDIGGPVGTSVQAFFEGIVFDQDYLPEEGDYGNVIILEHDFNGVKLWSLYGHLDSKSIKHLKLGEKVKSGQILGWLGDKNENGGWEPHLHFQISLEEPINCDMPGVVNPNDRDEALKKYLDPRLVLGELY